MQFPTIPIQHSQQFHSFEPKQCCSCKLAVAAIASFIFASIGVSSALLLASIIILPISTAISITALAISSLVLVSLLLNIRKTCLISPSNPKHLQFTKPKNEHVRTQIKESYETTFSPKTLQFLIQQKLIKYEGICLQALLTPAEQLCVSIWSTSFSQDMIKQCIGSTENPQIAEINQIFLQGLHKLPCAKNQSTLHAFDDIPPNILQQVYQPEHMYTLNYFLEASEKKKAFFRCQNPTRIYINGKTGKSIANVDDKPTILFSPGAKFIVQHVIIPPAFPQPTPPQEIHLLEV